MPLRILGISACSKSVATYSSTPFCLAVCLSGLFRRSETLTFRVRTSAWGTTIQSEKLCSQWINVDPGSEARDNSPLLYYYLSIRGLNGHCRSLFVMDGGVWMDFCNCLTISLYSVHLREFILGYACFMSIYFFMGVHHTSNIQTFMPCSCEISKPDSSLH